jgi:hypothetical protein
LRRRAAALLLGLAALLVVPGAAGVPNVPGDPTPPVVTPVITGTQGDAGWYTTNVTVNWSISDPESQHRHADREHDRDAAHVHRGERRRDHHGLEDVQGRQDGPGGDRRAVEER